MKGKAKERIVDILLVTANIAGLGTILLVLQKATQIPTSSWLTYSGFGIF